MDTRGEIRQQINKYKETNPKIRKTENGSNELTREQAIKRTNNL